MMYCLVPGEISSISDGDYHYIGVRQLVQLYGLRPGEYMVHDAIFARRACEAVPHLGPRYDGDYQPVPRDEHGRLLRISHEPQAGA
jgi:hypothetical protein